jgi:hypothetical protein
MGCFMYKIEISLRCSERFSEVLPDMLEITELAVESVVACSLLELFNIINVDGVSVSILPEEGMHIDDHFHHA